MRNCQYSTTAPFPTPFKICLEKLTIKYNLTINEKHEKLSIFNDRPLSKPDGTQIGEGMGVWLDLVNVRKMYRRVMVTGIADNFAPPSDTKSGVPPEPIVEWAEDSNGNNYDDNAPVSWQKTEQYVIFVHGWNMSYESAQN